MLTLSGLGWYLMKSSTSMSTSPRSVDSADTIITNLSVKRFSETGQLIHFMKTPKTQHFPNSNLHYFESPYVTLSQPDQPTWQVSAHFAKAKGDGSHVVFFENVIVHQNKDTRTSETTMTTEELIYLSKDQIAISNVPVLFNQPGRTVASDGVKIHLAGKHIELRKTYAKFLPNYA